MQVKRSEFLQKTKPALQKLLDKLLQEYAYASILATDSRAKSYSVSRRNVRVSEDGMLAARGFVVKVSDGARYGEYSFNQITEEMVDQIVERIREAVQVSKKVLPPTVRSPIPG